MILFLFLVMLLPLKRHPWFNFWIGPATFPQWMGMVCVIYALGYIVSRRRVPSYFRTWQARWYMILTTLMLISSLAVGRSFSGGPDPAVSTLSMLMLGFTTLAVVDTLQRLRLVLLTTIASVGWASLYVLREAIKMRSWSTGARTMGWVVGDGNVFGVCIALVLPLAWYMSREKGPSWEKSLCLGSAGLMLLATTLSGSRGGFLGAVAGALIIIWRSRHRARNLAVFGMLLIIFNLAYPSSPLQRFMNPTLRDRQNAEVRLVQWNIALRMVRENPVAGIGYGRFKEEMIKYVPADYDDKAYLAHNAFLHIAAELGLPAVVAFVAMFFSALRGVGRIRNIGSISAFIRRAASGLQVGLCGGVVSVSFVSIFEHRMLWFILFLTMVLEVISNQETTVASEATAWPV